MKIKRGDRRARIGVAVAAAAAATLGDLCMLYVVNAARPELALPQAPDLTLLLGGILGVLGIPFYWLGYACLAEVLVLETRGGRSPVILRTCGALIGGVGALIHALTALLIGLSDTTPATPLDALAGGGFAVLWLWMIAAAATVAAAVVVCAVAFSAEAPLPRRLALANPVTATLVLALIGAFTELGRSFLIPAAPNLAHLIFFATAYFTWPPSERDDR